jgi:tripartite-type tricarboxylate transporter receptor subunit TctC
VLRRLQTVLLAALAVVAVAPLFAQGAWPVRPVRLIVPYPPGASSNDILARVLAQKLSDSFGQTFVVDNRPGAGGTLGQELGARALPDGYTLTLATNGPMAIGPFTYDKLGYDPIRSYEHVTLFAIVPYVMAAHPSVAAKDAREFIALARARPGVLNFASAGSGTTPHLAGELFNSMAGIKVVHVPYKGGAAATADLLGGQVQVYFAGLPALLPLIRQGKLRALGMGVLKRSSALPDLPTIDEQGLKGYDVASWMGILAPARTPAAIVERLHREISKLMDTADMRERVLNQGAEPVAIGLKAFRDYVQVELDRWGPVARGAGVKAD